MKITALIWLEDFANKIAVKHGVKQREVREVFHSHPRFRFVEKGHRRGENVYSAMGQTDPGRHLIVFVFTTKKGKPSFCPLVI